MCDGRGSQLKHRGGLKDFIRCSSKSCGSLPILVDLPKEPGLSSLEVLFTGPESCCCQSQPCKGMGGVTGKGVSEEGCGRGGGEGMGVFEGV